MGGRNHRPNYKIPGKFRSRLQITSQGKVQEPEVCVKVRMTQETDLKSGYTKSQNWSQEPEPNQDIPRVRTRRYQESEPKIRVNEESESELPDPKGIAKKPESRKRVRSQKTRSTEPEIYQNNWDEMGSLVSPAANQEALTMASWFFSWVELSLRAPRQVHLTRQLSQAGLPISSSDK